MVNNLKGGLKMINLTDIDYLGIERVLKRGTGEIIASHENAFWFATK